VVGGVQGLGGGDEFRSQRLQVIPPLAKDADDIVRIAGGEGGIGVDETDGGDRVARLGVTAHGPAIIIIVVEFHFIRRRLPSSPFHQ